mmetsp:Transcript_36737/g.54929  ORF Transcript_36737/g.54929 Transcript_36737/m.54929 type:complete len:100 (-) Transcript_36737:55-354(-)
MSRKTDGQSLCMNACRGSFEKADAATTHATRHVFPAVIVAVAMCTGGRRQTSTCQSRAAWNVLRGMPRVVRSNSSPWMNVPDIYEVWPCLGGIIVCVMR